jgi:hypothetical protein
MALLVIGRSVGKKASNLAPDVLKIGAALVSIGPDKGGLSVPPPTIEELGQAIEAFQSFHRLPTRDGKVDPGGTTLRRINELLNPGPSPRPAPRPAGTGEIRAMTNTAGFATSVDQTTWTPVESSLASDMIFQWTGVGGRGKIHYFELDESVVPRWFGVLVPESATNFDSVHIFFHPTPSQAGYRDPDYHSLGNWPGIFHYLSDRMGSQFCAAEQDRVLFMPLMTQASAGTCGAFPQRWESIISRILGMLKSGNFSSDAPPAPISSVVVSSFSSGITYSHQFRGRATGLGQRLVGVIDFDGGISSYRQYSGMIRNPAGRIVSMQQMPASIHTLSILARDNVFPLPRPRWGGPYANVFPKNDGDALQQIHGTIPQTMMFIAARRAG